MKIQDKKKLSLNKLEYNYTNLTNTHILIYFDLNKAYDNVNIDLLNDLIANDSEINPELKRLWIPEYFAIKNYILSIGSKILYRKIGLAQGSSLSPMLFNYYVSKILETNALYRYINDPNIKTYIYADNILILTNKEYSAEYINDMIEAYTFACAQFNLSFNNPIVKRFTKVGIPICDLEKFPNIKETFKILGIEFYITNNSLCINYYPMIFNIKRINCCSFYIAIKYIKKYHLPKFNYYFKFIKCINNIQAEAYKTWFIDKINNWIKNVAIIYKLPNNCIDNIFFHADEDPLHDQYNYYSFWVGKFAHKFDDPILDKYKVLCDEIHKNKFIDAIDMIEFIYYDKVYNSDVRKYPAIKSLKTLDDIYFGLKTKRNLYENVIYSNLDYINTNKNDLIFKINIH